MKNIKQYESLVNAAFNGDTPRARLSSLLFAVRETLFSETANSVSIWITNHKDDISAEALILLQKDSVKFPREGGGESGKSLKAKYKVAIQIPSVSQKEIIGYLHFSSQPAISESQLQTLNVLISGELLELRRELTGRILYSLLDFYRAGLMRTTEPFEQKDLDEMGKVIANAFCNRPLCLLLYSLQAWRNPYAAPLAAFPGHSSLAEDLGQILDNDISEHIKQHRYKTPGGKITFETEPMPDLKGYEGSSFHFVLQPLVRPKESYDSKIPYLAIVFIIEPENRLNAFELEFLNIFLTEIERILRFRDEFMLMNRMHGLVQKKFPSFSSPDEVADSVAEYLDESFSASEVAILERRGNFLTVIAKDEDVKKKLNEIPPLHIPTRKAIVCEVAKKRKPDYSPDVRKKNNYLTVVEATRTQFTVPLIWQGDLVGVLLVGLSVVDGLEARHQEIIQLLAGFCAAAIKISRRASEERAIRNVLGEVLTGAALKIGFVLDDDKVKGENHSDLKTAYDSLNQFQQFIEKLHAAQSASKGKELIDLRDIVRKIENSPFLGPWLETHPKHSVVTVPFPESLIVLAYSEGLSIAVHNIVLNGLEAMEGKSGKVTISMKVEKVRFKAGSRKHVTYGVIKILDEGKGISLSEQVMMFDLFHSTKPNHFGGGLGIAKRFIEGFGGKIEYYSMPGEKNGSEFSLWIPLSTENRKK